MMERGATSVPSGMVRSDTYFRMSEHQVSCVAFAAETVAVGGTVAVAVGTSVGGRNATGASSSKKYALFGAQPLLAARNKHTNSSKPLRNNKLLVIRKLIVQSVIGFGFFLIASGQLKRKFAGQAALPDSMFELLG